MEFFHCYVCTVEIPTAFRNEHHKIPRSTGGLDDTSNLVDLCVSCHDALHILGVMSLSQRRGGEVKDTAKALLQNNSAVARMLELVSIVRDHHILKRDGKIKLPPGSEVLVTSEIPVLYKEALSILAQTMTNPDTGRRYSMSSLVRTMVMQSLERKFPFLKKR